MAGVIYWPEGGHFAPFLLNGCSQVDTQKDYIMKLIRMPIEMESPEQFGYDRIKYNLTESSVRDRTLQDIGLSLNDDLLCYGDHVGREDLRQAIADISGDVDVDDVLVTPGAAAALFFTSMAMLNDGDHIVVMRPNYATNIETPRMMGCDISYYDLLFEEGFKFNLERLSQLIRPSTRFISLTFPHNPTGTSVSPETLLQVIKFAEELGIRLLIDETYREMTRGPMLPSAASLSPIVVAVSSLSKTYGVPGVRIGWVICRDKEFMNKLLCAKEQVVICGSVLDEAAALKVLHSRDEWIPYNNNLIAMQLDMVRSWVKNDSRFEWVEPAGGCVCFPRIRPDLDVNIDEFYAVLNNEFGVYVGPGHWFEQSRRHFRVGYAWPLKEELVGGLKGLSAALDKVLE